MWNTPFELVKNIKEILSELMLLDSIPVNYETWLNTLSNYKLKNNEQIRSLLDDSLNLLKDNQTDFHIMNLEGLLKSDDSLSISERIANLQASGRLDHYRNLYQTDINKRKALLIESIRYTSMMQLGDLVVLKYRPEVTFYNLWNEFYMETRGLVIDIANLKLVSTPYRKFFNLNENAVTQIDRVTELINKATKVVIKNKEDGSMISASNYHGQCIVSTPGSLESSQAKWAKQYLISNHSAFYLNTPPDLTFIFEAIYPENRIVVDYKDREGLILTNIRSKLTGKLLSESEVESYAQKFGFSVPLKETKTLKELLDELKDAKKYPASEKEGWVFVVKTPDEELLFKLKCDDYCEIHKIIGFATSPKIIFNHIKEENFDDFVVKVPELLKPITLKIADIIRSSILETQHNLNFYLQSIPSDSLYSSDELNHYRELKVLFDNTLIPNINLKLSRNAKKELEEALWSKIFGKEVSLDKWMMKELDNLWNLIPENLRNLKSFKKKQGKLLGFVKRNIPTKYQPLVFNAIDGKPYNCIDILDFKEIRFDDIQDSIANYQDN